MKNLRSLSRRFGAYGTQALALVGGTAATLSAHAAGTAVDVTDTVSTIGLQLVPVGLVGVAILGVMVAVAAFVWIRKAVH